MYNRKVSTLVAPRWGNPIRYFFIIALIVSLVGYAGSSVAPVRAASNNPMYVSFDGNVTFNGVTFADDDIIKYTGTAWEFFFDGSDVGLGTGPDTTAFTFWDANNALLAFSETPVPGLNGGTLTVTPNDIALFNATQWGTLTQGTFSLFLTGANVGLENTTSEKIDAISVLPDATRSLLISTAGNPTVPVTVPPTAGTITATDEDILKYTPNVLGDYSSGTWSLYFDGTDVGLDSGNDIDAVDVVGTTVYFSGFGLLNPPFTVQGVTGDNQDVFSCTLTVPGDPTTCTIDPFLYFDSSIFSTELGAMNLDAFVHLDTPAAVAPRLVSFRLQNPATSPTSADSLVFRATFNEEVANVNAADFVVTGTTATIQPVLQVSPSVYDIPVAGGNLAGLNGVVGINLSGAQNITDLDLPANALVAAEPAIDETYTLDNVVPTVSSIVRADPDHTTAAIVDFTVTFSESVTGVDTGDFSLTTSPGLTGASVTAVNGTGAIYSVTVNTGSGTGTIGLNVPNAATITDLAGSSLGNLPFNSGEVYTIVSGNVVDTTGVFRPSNGYLFLKNKNTTGFADLALNYGLSGDYPVVGDWDGNGTVTIGIYRNGTFFLRNSNSVGFADIVFAFGTPGDQPVAGDWDGDGIDTIGVYRSAIGQFFLRNTNSPGPEDVNFFLGNTGDVGIAGDWNGDGIDTTGVFRPSNGYLFLKNANTTGIADIALNYGLPGDKPVTGDWDGSGTDTIGVYRNGTFFLRNSNTNGFAEMVFVLGNPGDMPISGDWDGQPPQP